MGWELEAWACGGLLARRGDGEKMFLYRRLGPPEGYVVRWRGRAAGELIRRGPRCGVSARWVLESVGPVSEQDLLEVAGLLG